MRELLGSRAREGFETKLDVEGYANYVIAEGVDKTGFVLGTSTVFKIFPHPNMTAAAVEVESAWLIEANSKAAAAEAKDAGEWYGRADEGSGQPEAENSFVASIIDIQMAAFVVGFVSCDTIAVVVLPAWRRGQRERFSRS